ncbi:hypothetical protein HanRHA438_Chr04g0150241 [Helianthus annuus]|nr:hypothetical protein HanHA300_Chr12g0428881 [Helianthus annuus]KAJ0595055.1 hypothetical protein HanHA89_Chr04g0127151 [Helianthus annuus]KAJ0673559.1 hypothetical protein HanLR1_Chr12g0430501 [Helianthus annuus]KAJ0924590.1 hypothetical protein HanRHA438_Chr04g0150241 [Helianthus annuus]
MCFLLYLKNCINCEYEEDRRNGIRTGVNQTEKKHRKHRRGDQRQEIRMKKNLNRRLQKV